MTEQRRRVLVVDDEETVRSVLKRILEGAGYKVITAANGEEALYEMSQQEIKVVLLDIKMPGMSGIEVLGKLTHDRPDTCAIMVTAVADAQTAVEAMKMGAYDYIVKPFDQSEVVQKVQKAIARWNHQLEEKRHYLELRGQFLEKTTLMQEQFTELIESLGREHKLLHELAASQADGGKSMLSELPPELQKPMSSVEEFRDALLRILRRS